MLEKASGILAFTATVGVVATLATVPLLAQSKPWDSATVTRVRVASTETGETVAGRLIHADDGGLVIRPTGSSATVDVSRGNLKRLEISTGRPSGGRRLRTRALVGAMTLGGAFGMLPPCAHDTGDGCDSDRVDNYIGGALVGGLFGAVSALFPGKERWREIDASSVRSGVTSDQWAYAESSTYSQRFMRNAKWASYAGAATGVLYGATFSKDCTDLPQCDPVGIGDRVFVAIVAGWGATAFGSTIGAVVAIVPIGGHSAQSASLIAPTLQRGQAGFGLALTW